MVKKTLKTRHFHYKALAQAKRYIRLNFHQKISLKKIAKFSGVSEFHFARIFMAYTHESPLQYIKKLRVKEAIHLMEDDQNLSITNIALSVGYELIPLVDKNLSKENITEYLGLSLIENNADDDGKMIYLAGVNMNEAPKKLPKGLSYKHFPGGKYAKFMLIGATHQVWDAFNQIFKVLSEKNIKLRDGACIENYLSNPEIIPEDQLVTELLVPIV